MPKGEGNQATNKQIPHINVAVYYCSFSDVTQQQQQYNATAACSFALMVAYNAPDVLFAGFCALFAAVMAATMVAVAIE